MNAHARSIVGSTGEGRSARAIVVALIAAVAMVVTLILAPPPPPAVAVTDEDPSFVLTQNDLEFILRQIQISEAHAADETNPSNYELYCPDQGVAAQNCVSDVMKPAGVRTVDGSYNNLLVTEYGASDNAFPRLLEPEWRQAEPEVANLEFDPNTPAQTAMCDPGLTCYEQTEGIVYDSHPREISNLIVDQTLNNPAIENQLEAGTAARPLPQDRELVDVSHLMIANPFRGAGMGRLFATHPPMADRIARLEGMASPGTGAGGITHY